MKHIKPIYIYLSGLIIIVVIVLFMSNSTGPNGSTVINVPQSGITDKPMPQDQIHKGLENPLGQQPGKNNVMSSIMQQMEKLKKESEEHPRDTLKLREYADFLAEAHQKEQAMKLYQKILNINPRRVDILTSIVFIYFSDNDLDNCEKYLNRILQVDKNNLDALYNLGVVSANKGNKENARKIWLKIVEKYPNSEMATKARESIARL